MPKSTPSRPAPRCAPGAEPELSTYYEPSLLTPDDPHLFALWEAVEKALWPVAVKAQRYRRRRVRLTPTESRLQAARFEIEREAWRLHCGLVATEPLLPPVPQLPRRPHLRALALRFETFADEAAAMMRATLDDLPATRKHSWRPYHAAAVQWRSLSALVALVEGPGGCLFPVYGGPGASLTRRGDRRNALVYSFCPVTL